MSDAGTWEFLRNNKGPVKRGFSKLTEETAREVKKMLKEGSPRKKIVVELGHLGVKPHHVADIATGKIWKHV